MCNHDLVVKDNTTGNNSFKITECKMCGDITNVVMRGDKETVWDVKDRRITRMSAIKSAVDLSISAEDYTLDNVKDLAGEIEKWIYRKE